MPRASPVCFSAGVKRSVDSVGLFAANCRLIWLSAGKVCGVSSVWNVQRVAVSCVAFSHATRNSHFPFGVFPSVFSFVSRYERFTISCQLAMESWGARRCWWFRQFSKSQNGIQHGIFYSLTLSKNQTRRAKKTGSGFEFGMLPRKPKLTRLAAARCPNTHLFQLQLRISDSDSDFPDISQLFALCDACTWFDFREREWEAEVKGETVRNTARKQLPRQK